MSSESDTLVDVKHFYGFENYNVSVQGQYLDEKKKELPNLKHPVVISSWHKEDFDVEGFDKEAYAFVSTSYNVVYLLKESWQNEVKLLEYSYDPKDGLSQTDSITIGEKGMLNLMT